MLRGSGLYSIAIMGQRLLAVALLPVTTRFLVPADYGMLDLLEQAGSLLSLLLGASFPSALGYFYFQNQSPAARGRAVATAVLGGGLLGALACAACWPFARVLSRAVFGGEAAVHSLHIVFATMPPVFALEALLAWLRVENRPRVWLLGSLTRLATTAVAVVLFVAVLRLRVVGVQYGILAATLVPVLILGARYAAEIRASFDAALFVRMARFAAPLGLSGIAMFIVNFGDRFVLRRYVSFADLGLYALAYKIGMLIGALYAAFQIHWNSQVFSIMRRRDAEDVFARACTYVVLGVAFGGLGIVVCSRPALHLLAAPSYHGAAGLIPVLTLAYCVRSVGEFFRSLFLVEGRPGCDAACAWIASCVCLAGYFLLIPRYGTRGAAAATAITFLVLTALSIAWTYRLRPFRVEAARLAKVAVAAALCAVAYWLFPMITLLSQIAWASLLIAAFPALLWALRFPTAGERSAALAAARVLWRRVASK